MPQKTARSSRSDWKTGDQLLFLLSYWETFKSAQDSKTLDRFWPKVFEEWYVRWPIPKNMDSGDRLVSQKEKNGKIKNWFNNRCRGTDLLKGPRGDLKLDVNEKRKLAPLQAYCSYAWHSTLRPIVLTRWEQQKGTLTFNDDEDPPEDAEGSPEEACIPLSFKLKIARELYDQLTKEQKKMINDQREEDKKKMGRRVTDIDDDEERHLKLRVHQRNQPSVVKSLNRVLANLEDQTGCVAQLIIASVSPTGGAPSIQKFCQGETPHGLKFEPFYGAGWEENVENKFRQWAVRVFGERGSERRSKYLLPKDPAASSEDYLSEFETNDEASSSGSQTNAEASSSQNPPTGATPSQKSTSRPLKSQKPVPQPSIFEEVTPQPSVVRASLSMPTSIPQPLITSDSPQSTLTLTSNLPMPDTSFNPLTDHGEDMALLATADGVHQLLSQVAVAPQVVQDPLMVSPVNFNAVEPSQLVISPLRIIAEPSQSIIRPSHAVVEPSHAIVEPSQVVVKPSQVVIEPPQVVVEPPQVVIEPSQPDSTIIPTPPQPLTKVVNATSNSLTPKVPYRVQDPATRPSGKPSRRDSIEGAPEIVVDPTNEQEMIVDVINDEQEVTVDLRDYITMDFDDSESHVSSSQKTADASWELTLPPPDSQQRHNAVGGKGESMSRSGFASSRTRPQLDIDEGDLPVWMTKKGQWRYVASTAGGIAWENLLKVYMNQERRLEFTEMGATLTNEDRPLKIKEYFQYAHQPSRGDTLTVPGFGVEVAKWWEKIQPEWRCSKQDLPQNRSQWSYILSGGSKGAFLVILCLAWWDRAYERHLEKQKKARWAEAEAAGIIANFDDLLDHDAEWLNTVNDVAFVMRKARDCDILTQGVPSPSHKGKRKHQEDSATSEQMPAAKRSLRKRSKV